MDNAVHFLFSPLAEVIAGMPDQVIRTGEADASSHRDDAMFRAVLENMNDAVYVRDLGRKLIYINPAAERMTGWSMDEALAKPCYEVFGDPGHACNKLCPIDACLARGEPVQHQEGRLVRRDGAVIDARVSISPLFDGEAIVGSVVVMQDLSELREIEKTNLKNVMALQRAEKELVAARDAAEAANQAKSDFLSAMSHELRTPLNAILGFAQLLELDAKTQLSAEHGSYVEQINAGGEHLLGLINEILDLAKIESGGFAVEIGDVNPCHALEECMPLVTGMAKELHVDLCFGDPPDFTVRADGGRLKQVFLNLLSNAIKYNRDGGQVHMYCATTADNMLRINVEDTGTGIPAELHDKVFEPFNRLGAEKTGIEGSGIGLTLTKEIIERMDGRIGFQSAAGEGSTFWIELKLAQ